MEADEKQDLRYFNGTFKPFEKVYWESFLWIGNTTYLAVTVDWRQSGE